MFGWRKKGDPEPVATREIHRDQAAELFMSHCRKEAQRLESVIRESLITNLGWPPDKIDLEGILSRPFVSFRTRGFTSVGWSLLGAHCYGISLATGLDAIWDHVEPYGQKDVILFITSRLIVEEDVGPDNVGVPPGRAKKSRPGRHVNYVPGHFVGGVPSQQKKLVDGFRQIRTPAGRAAMLVLALGLTRSCGGLSVVIYEEEDRGGGIFAGHPVGIRPADSRDLEEWTQHIEIRIDPELVFSEVPIEFRDTILAAVEEVDPFWPTFCDHHVLVYY
jgi:hypothetical protein